MKIKLTKKQKTIIIDQFSNNENATDQELIEFFSEHGIDEAVTKRLIEEERPMFFTNPVYVIDWDNHEGKVIVSYKQVKELFEKETGVSASIIKEIHEAFPIGRSITIHSSDRTWIGWLDVNGKLQAGSLKEEGK